MRASSRGPAKGKAVKGFDYEEPAEKSVPKEAHRERKHHEQAQGKATEERQEVKRVLAREQHTVGFQGRCVLNPEGADPAKYRR